MPEIEPGCEREWGCTAGPAQSPCPALQALVDATGRAAARPPIVEGVRSILVTRATREAAARYSPGRTALVRRTAAGSVCCYEWTECEDGRTAAPAPERRMTP